MDYLFSVSIKCCLPVIPLLGINQPSAIEGHRLGKGALSYRRQIAAQTESGALAGNKLVLGSMKPTYEWNGNPATTNYLDTVSNV